LLLARVRKQAKAVICQSNLKQLGQCFEMYTSDNKGFFQQGYWGLPDCQGSNWWMDAIAPYYRDQDICLCPMASQLSCEVRGDEIGSTFIAWSACSWLTDGRYGSYAVNGWLENDQCETDSYANDRWRTTNIKGAKAVPLLVDAPWIDAWPMSTHDPPEYYDIDWRYCSSLGRLIINRHDAYNNCVFLDYSVRRIGIKEVYTLKWSRNFNTNGPWTKAGRVQKSDWPEWLRDFKDY
jgi:hypothetical protein